MHEESRAFLAIEQAAIDLETQFKGTGKRDLIWLKVVSLERS